MQEQENKKSHKANGYKHIFVNTALNPLKSGILRQLPDFLIPVTIEGSKADGCPGAGGIEGCSPFNGYIVTKYNR